MLNSANLSKKSIEKIYRIICAFHEKHLKQYGVVLPSLLNTHGDYIKDALVLVYLAKDYPNTKMVSKEELTRFIRGFYPNTNDVQQARHLGAQKGWWIVAGGRDNIVLNLKRGSYQLHTLEQPYPGFTQGHRIAVTDDWETLKARYSFRCATCGFQEGQPHLHWPATKTKLQKAHMDPNKSLIAGNIIPQCQKCNRGDRNRWIYDNKGRVIKLADPNVIKTCGQDVQKAVYKILYRKYSGRKPDSIDDV